MLPPYDSRETLDRIALAIRETGARRVFCLGDSFHDAGGAARLEPHAAGMLAALMRATDWVWIAGNHDGAAALAGGSLDELAISGVTLRHAARRAEGGAEVSGHFHPRLTVTVRGRRISRPCTVRSETRLVLPALGALTGGMNAADPAIRAALHPAARADALLTAAGRMVCFPLWREA
jgi:DNA ligase-associated metallophosphoesterase